MKTNKLKDFFDFNHYEKIGITFILILTVVLLFLPTIHNLIRPAKTPDYTAFEKEIAEFENSLVPKDEDYLNRLDKFIVNRYDSLQLFNFDPNNTTEEQWKKLGLTDKQIKTIQNYLGHGGKFYEKEDFRKVYGIRTKQYEILKPYIQIKELAKNDENQKFQKKEAEFFAFDPNVTSSDDFQRLGFTEKQAEVIINYVTKGGKFYKKEDFQKMYCVTNEMFEKLEPYINITEINDKKLAANKWTEKDINSKFVDINFSDTTEFLNLPAVYSVTAKNIVNYRKQLGGFTRIEQIKEIYGMKDDIYTKIVPFLKLNNSQIKKININLADFKEFKHPYLTYTNIKNIINYRDKNGPFTNLNQLVNAKLLLGMDFEKIKPYLKL